MNKDYKTKIRFLGDLHQEYDGYLNLIKDCDYSIQVGDVGYNYSYLRKQQNINWDNHKAVFGNHENYDINSSEYCLKQPFSLGNYGTHTFDNSFSFFFLRGAWSIDYKVRQAYEPTWGKTWWPEEELSVAELNSAIEMYKAVKPQVMVSHEAPISIVHNFTDPDFPTQFGWPAGVQKTRTSLALQAMFEYHKPKFWIYGHYHTRFTDIINGTIFIGLDMYRDAKQTSNYFDMEVLSE